MNASIYFLTLFTLSAMQKASDKLATIPLFTFAGPVFPFVPPTNKNFLHLSTYYFLLYIILQILQRLFLFLFYAIIEVRFVLCNTIFSIQFFDAIHQIVLSYRFYQPDPATCFYYYLLLILQISLHILLRKLFHGMYL